MQLDEGMVVTVEGLGKFVVTSLWESDTSYRYCDGPGLIEKLEMIRFRGEYEKEAPDAA